MTPERGSFPTINDVSLQMKAIKFSWRNFVRAGIKESRFDFLILEKLTSQPSNTVRAFCQVGPTIGVASRWTLYTLSIQVEGESVIRAMDFIQEICSEASDEMVDAMHSTMFRVLVNSLAPEQPARADER